jgi:two-component system, NarL family, nitrate/nitrite response regulator NarL
MGEKLRVAILDDHQGIIDGYLYRLSGDNGIEVAAAMTEGKQLEPLLEREIIDVLLLDVQVPICSTNPAPYPILHLIPKLLQTYPHLTILVISMYAQRSLISAVMEAGASGYILKDDQAAIRDLASIIQSVAAGGIYLSLYAYQQLIKRQNWEPNQGLSPRQVEALSLCAAYPQASTDDLARMMQVANSTLRNLLSGSYVKLNVRTRAAAIARIQQLGLVSPTSHQLDIDPPASIGG